MSQDPNEIRVKKEPGTDTTIGGVAKTKFAPKIPARRRGTPTNPSPTPLSTSPAPNAQGQGLEFIQMKEERKRNDRDKERDNRKERENQPAKVAFMPSVGGGGDDEAPQYMDISESSSSSSSSSGPNDKSAHKAPKEIDPDILLDNGDLYQYRPVMLPFPARSTNYSHLKKQSAERDEERERKTAIQIEKEAYAGLLPPYLPASARQALGTSSYAAAQPAAATGSISSFFDDFVDDAPAGHDHARRERERQREREKVHAAQFPPNPFPPGSAAHLLSMIDQEEKSSNPSERLIFFQLPSHLPFKQNSGWAPPTAQNQGNKSPTLLALQAMSSPSLPPLSTSSVLPPSLSLSGTTSSSSAPRVANRSSTGNSSMEEEVDLGEIGVKREGTGAPSASNAANLVTESERLAKEFKQRQQRKLMLFSSNFEHAVRHVPGGVMGKLVVYKSGKIKMKVGDVVLDVSEGVQTMFHQELIAISAQNQEAHRLGPVHHKFVCTIDVDDLAKKTRERKFATNTNAQPQVRESWI